MQWKRMSVRRLMAVILATGTTLGLSIPGFQTWQDEEVHAHTFVAGGVWESATGADKAYTEHGLKCRLIRPTAWSRYLGHLSGIPGRKKKDCGERLGRVAEVCCWENPEVVYFSKWEGGWAPFQPTPEQAAEMSRLDEKMLEQVNASLPVLDDRPSVR
jgi:hypothetical protein